MGNAWLTEGHIEMIERIPRREKPLLRSTTELASYAAACFSMHMQAHMLGVEFGVGAARVEAHLCEDFRTVSLDAGDSGIRASFMFDEKVNPSDFEHWEFEDGFNNPDG